MEEGRYPRKAYDARPERKRPRGRRRVTWEDIKTTFYDSDTLKALPVLSFPLPDELCDPTDLTWR